MLVGTLSTERQRACQLLTGRGRRECIADAIARFTPDLLVCAGHSLRTNNDLDSLLRDKRIKRAKSAIIVEVENDKLQPKGQFPNCLYVILPSGRKKSLGRQMFAKSKDLKGDGAPELINKFERAIRQRRFRIKGKVVLVLACGEINILYGRNTVTSRSARCMKAIDDADIIANPTHDRMGNAGTLRAKRKFLSKRVNGRNRLYVSSSNWETKPKRPRKAQRPGARTLHDFFLFTIFLFREKSCPFGIPSVDFIIRILPTNIDKLTSRFSEMFSSIPKGIASRPLLDSLRRLDRSVQCGLHPVRLTPA
jgi:hypothetical protein